MANNLVETIGLLSNRAVTVVSMPEEEWVWK